MCLQLGPQPGSHRGAYSTPTQPFALHENNQKCCHEMFSQQQQKSHVLKGYPNLMPLYGGLFHLWNFRSSERKFSSSYLLFDALVRWNLLTQRHKVCSPESRNSALSYDKNPVSLYHLGLGLLRYRDVTKAGQMDRQADKRNHDSQYALMGRTNYRVDMRADRVGQANCLIQPYYSEKNYVIIENNIC